MSAEAVTKGGASLSQSLNPKAAGRGENGDFRVPERSVLNVHRALGTQKKRHLQTGMATLEQALTASPPEYDHLRALCRTR